MLNAAPFRGVSACRGSRQAACGRENGEAESAVRPGVLLIASAQVSHVRERREAGRHVGGDTAGVGAAGAHGRGRRTQLTERCCGGHGDGHGVAVTAMLPVDAHRFEQPGPPRTSRGGRPHTSLRCRSLHEAGRRARARHVGEDRLGQVFVVLRARRDRQSQQRGTVQHPDGQNLTVSAPGPDGRSRRLRAEPPVPAQVPGIAAAQTPRPAATPALRRWRRSALRLLTCSRRSTRPGVRVIHRAFPGIGYPQAIRS